MISPETIQIVKSTAPILQENGETLTKHFYKRLLSNNPEVKPFFNASNQSVGSQQRALAAAITAYATHIDDLGALSSAVELIAHKHVSLQVKPEHYPIVGGNLLASIQEVLGEAATDEIVNAWAEAYGFLTKVLTAREEEILKSNETRAGGWRGFRNFKINRIEKESLGIRSFYLKPEDQNTLPIFLPGQYITLRLPTSDGSTTMRNYSLSEAPGKDYFRISVKHEKGDSLKPEGYVSTRLHREYKVGDTLEVGAPCGEFFLDRNKNEGAKTSPLVLLAGGIGITPILSILEAALEKEPKREVCLIYGCLNPENQAFLGTLDGLVEKYENLKVHSRYSHFDEEIILTEGFSKGFVDGDLLEANSLQEADYYFCGPKPFMVNIYQYLKSKKLSESQINYEFFGPKEELEG